MTAMRGGTPDRVPMPLRMWKFLRKHHADVPDPLARALAAQQEFGIDVWHYVAQPPMPCFQPIGTPWRTDIDVDLWHEADDGRQYWRRTIHTPEGDLHDAKQALIVARGSGDGPEIVEPLIKDLKRDLPLIRYMMADPAEIDVDSARRADERIGDRGLAVASMMSPIDCRDVLKQTDFLMLYHDDADAFRRIVQIGADAMMAETKRVLEAGFQVVKTWWFYASPSVGWSPQIYENVFLPHLVAHVELVHRYGALYVYYDDGKMSRFMDMIVDAGIDCLMTLTPPPMGDVLPVEAKRRYGDRVCLMGGIDAVNEVLRGDPASIRSMVRERLSVYMPDGGYIMDGSNSLVYETPVENVRALAQAGQEFGAYP